MKTISNNITFNHIHIFIDRIIYILTNKPDSCNNYKVSSVQTGHQTGHHFGLNTDKS